MSDFEKDYKNISAELDDAIVKQLSENISEEEQIELDELHEAAQNYLNIINDCENQLKWFSNTLKKQHDYREAIKNEKKISQKREREYIENKNMIQNWLIGDIPKKIISETFRFQEKLNTFLGTKIAMLLVYDDGNGPELYQITSEDILSYSYSSSYNLIGKYSQIFQNQEAKLKESLKKIKIEEQLLKFSLIGLKETRAEVLKRYTIASQIGKKHGKKRYHYVLWEDINSKWKKMKVLNKGDIEEAYAVFILNNKKDPSFEDGTEENVEKYLVYGVNKVDNISGLLTGDFSLKQKNFEIGIKSINASTLGLHQVKKLATQIVEDKNFDKSSLQKIKDNLEKKGVERRQRQEEFLSSTIDNEIINILKNK